MKGIGIRRGRQALLLLAIVAATLMILNARLKHIEDAPAMDAAPWALETAEARKGEVTDGFPALGIVHSASEVRITPQIGGTILELGPRAGDHVEKGELLVHLDTRELEASRDALKSRLESARAALRRDMREFERERRLFEEGGSSRSAVEAWQVKVEAGRANVRALSEQIRQLDVKIAHGHIRSPLSASVARRLAEVGDTAMPGRAIYVLSASSGGRVVVPVPLRTLKRTRPGGEMVLSEGGERQTVRITRVNPSLDKLAMGSVEIDLPKRPFGLPDGARVSARVLTGRLADVVVIPADSLLPLRRQGRRVVFRVVGDGERTPFALRETLVDVPSCGREGCAVAAGLSEGDRVVVAHASVLLKLRDGDRVLPFGERRSPAQ